MSPLAASTVSPVRHQISTRIGFFIAGFAMSAWAPLVPFAKARLGLDDGEMGLMLLCLGAGSFVTMPLAGAAAARFGCRAVIAAMVGVMAVGLPLLASLDSVAAFACALLVFGAGLGALDVTINIQAIIVERDSGRAMMSGFHGLFSVGGIGGALAVSGMLGAGMGPLGAVLVVSGVAVVAEVLAFPGQLSYGGRSDGPAFALPRGVVLLLGVLCCIVFLTEGAVLDWSALFLSGAGFVEPSQGGLGYAAFSAAMTLVRRWCGAPSRTEGIGGGRRGDGGFGTGAGNAGAVCLGVAGGVRAGGDRVREYRAGAVFSGWAPAGDAGGVGSAFDHDAGLCGDLGGAGGDWVRGAVFERGNRVVGSGGFAGGGGGQCAAVASVSDRRWIGGVPKRTPPYECRAFYSAAMAGRALRRRSARSIHWALTFSAKAFWRRRSFRAGKSTRSSAWSWLKQLNTIERTPVMGSIWGWRHWAQTSFIMHCIGELMEPMAEWPSGR
jgi:hypothetical protein